MHRGEGGSTRTISQIGQDLIYRNHVGEEGGGASSALKYKKKNLRGNPNA